MKYAMGAKRNPIRDLPVFEVSAVPLPPKVTTDLSMIPILDQGQQPACVGHAFATALMYDYYKKTGTVPLISPRFIYSQAKLLDGDPTGEGTSAYYAFQGIQKFGGAPTIQTVPNQVTLNLTDYMTVVITNPITQEAKEYPIKTEIEVQNPTDCQLQTLLAQYGLVIIAVDVDENSWMEQGGKGLLLPGNAGGHEIALHAYDSTIPGTEYTIRNSWTNSWGTNGDGKFLYSNYQGNIYDAMVITIDMENPIQTVTLTRDYSDPKETKGSLAVKLATSAFTCDTLELPNLGNQHNISCIPAGIYQCQTEHFSPLNITAYEVMNVPGRSGIFIHPGNYASGKIIDTDGCILIGNAFQDINGDGQDEIINSRVTFAQFMQAMGGKPFTLIIK